MPMNKERPILMSAPMVSAIRKGLKTETRRLRGLNVLNAEPDAWVPMLPFETELGFGFVRRDDPTTFTFVKSPYGKRGDRLWVKETWATIRDEDGCSIPELTEMNECGPASVFYRDTADHATGKWRPSIFMPRWASRLDLENKRAVPQRLWDMTLQDAEAEGAMPCPHRCAGSPEINLKMFGRTFLTEPELPWCREPSGIYDCRKCGFRQLWNSIHAQTGHSFEKNPWVWVVGFEVVQHAH